VMDAVATVVQVRNFAGAAQGLATTTLRAVIGDIPLDDVLSKREEINSLLRTKLDEVTERWGVRVTNVEIREIVPPREIQAAMNRQMSAERTKRALVLESEGQQQAAILVAEGEKESAILVAEGERESARLRAEGYALALSNVFESARTVDSKTMSLQYLEALRSLAAGPSKKWVVPAELGEMLGKVVRGAGE
jgi:regulator of protease activity HflC (stomatin/prohibitin superfamily)